MVKVNFFIRFKNQIVLVLVVAVSVLFMTNLVKYGYVSKAGVVQNKEFIDGTSKIIGAALLLIGAIASYYRFFRGRTFAARADLKLEVAVYDTDQGFQLHVINLEVRNIGNVTIWEPNPVVVVYSYGPSQTAPQIIDGWSRPLESEPADNPSLIDTQENAQFYATRQVPTDVWAVTYIARVESRNRVTWRRALTVSNAVASKGTTKA